jgi:nucleotidyltransferase substrate binding protein (TIGR01987 family)
MTYSEDIRWKQRFESFEKAFLRLKESIEKENLNELEQNGLIQRFEFTIELAWKVMKDFLAGKGFLLNASPKNVLREAQQAGYISYAQELIDGINLRNELSHDYSMDKFADGVTEIRQNIFPALEELHHFFLQEIQNSD